MSCTPLPKAAKPVWAKQLTRLPCLVVYVKSQFVYIRTLKKGFKKRYLWPYSVIWSWGYPLVVYNAVQEQAFRVLLSLHLQVVILPWRRGRAFATKLKAQGSSPDWCCHQAKWSKSCWWDLTGRNICPSLWLCIHVSYVVWQGLAALDTHTCWFGQYWKSFRWRPVGKYSFSREGSYVYC